MCKEKIEVEKGSGNVFAVASHIRSTQPTKGLNHYNVYYRTYAIFL